MAEYATLVKQFFNEFIRWQNEWLQGGRDFFDPDYS
jgi:hypothetical protein